jgi:hypothetical protein
LLDASGDIWVRQPAAALDDMFLPDLVQSWFRARGVEESERGD